MRLLPRRPHRPFAAGRHHGDGCLRRLGSRRPVFPRAGQLSAVDFRDHVPDLLDRLADRLRGKEASIREPGRLHGDRRWSQGYTIVEVVNELGHLRSTLIRDTFQFWQEQGFDPGQVEGLVITINEVVDEAIGESARQYYETTRSHGLKLIAEVAGQRASADFERIKLQTTGQQNASWDANSHDDAETEDYVAE